MELRIEKVFRIILVFIIIGFPLFFIGYKILENNRNHESNIFSIIAAVPEDGGFDLEYIRVVAGETFILNVSVPDVVHGLAIGPGLGIDLGNIYPGETKQFEIRIDEPGRYTAYCNTWCSPNHWRMRLTIEVFDSENPNSGIEEINTDPIIASLLLEGINIDDPHQAQQYPSQPFSYERGEIIVSSLNLPSHYFDNDWLRSQSPVEVWEYLRELKINDEEAWDGVSFLWQNTFQQKDLDLANYLYAKNCAACHGETGLGDGPGAKFIQDQEFHSLDGSDENQPIPAFNDRPSMLGGSGQIYYAKIRRGGMGTGMPGFGPIFTQEESWLLVDYIWGFVFSP